MRAQAEATLLSSLPCHPNIVQFWGFAKRKVNRQGQRATEVLILTDFYAGGGLPEALASYRSSPKGGLLGEMEILQLFLQACFAVAHLHMQSPPIAHRDVKLENLLLTGGLMESARGDGGHALVLCDFGKESCCGGLYLLESLTSSRARSNAFDTVTSHILRALYLPCLLTVAIACIIMDTRLSPPSKQLLYGPCQRSRLVEENCHL